MLRLNSVTGGIGFAESRTVWAIRSVNRRGTRGSHEAPPLHAHCRDTDQCGRGWSSRDILLAIAHNGYAFSHGLDLAERDAIMGDAAQRWYQLHRC